MCRSGVSVARSLSRSSVIPIGISYLKCRRYLDLCGESVRQTLLSAVLKFLGYIVWRNYNMKWSVENGIVEAWKRGECSENGRRYCTVLKKVKTRVQLNSRNKLIFVFDTFFIQYCHNITFSKILICNTFVSTGAI